MVRQATDNSAASPEGGFRTFESCVEGHGPQTDYYVANKGYDEYRGVGVPQAVPDASDTQVQKHQVGEGVDSFSTVRGDVVVLGPPHGCEHTTTTTALIP